MIVIFAKRQTNICVFNVDLEGGKFFFNTVREGDSVLFATEDEKEAHDWVMAFYRATGQAHKPTPPVSTGKTSTVSGGNQGGMSGSQRNPMLATRMKIQHFV